MRTIKNLLTVFLLLGLSAKVFSFTVTSVSPIHANSTSLVLTYDKVINTGTLVTLTYQSGGEKVLVITQGASSKTVTFSLGLKFSPTNQTLKDYILEAAIGTTKRLGTGSNQGDEGDSTVYFQIPVVAVPAITSSATLTADEGTNKTYTLATNYDDAQFSILSGDSRFSLSGTNNTTLNFNGTNTDFESTTKQYTLQVNESSQNITQDITLALTDLNDTTPTDITLTGTIDASAGVIEDGKRIVLDFADRGVIATLNTVDADTNNTFTYSVTGGDVKSSDATKYLVKISNDGTQLELNSFILDYETDADKKLSFTIEVNDGNGHTFSKDFSLDIRDINDTAPTNLEASTLLIGNSTLANTVVATFSATDADTTGETLVFSIVSDSNSDAAKFDITEDGKLSIKEAVNFDTKSSYTVAIRVRDGLRDAVKMFTFTVVKVLAFTSTATLSTNEGAANTDYTLAATNTTAEFSIVAGTNTSNLFSLSGTTLSFNGTNTDFESATKQYTVQVKASIGTGNDKNATQDITLTLNDLNDETPTAINLSDSRNISESTAVNTELGTLSAIDADATNNFSYTSSNAIFEVADNKLKLKTAIDYEPLSTNKTVSTTIQVNDGNNNTYSEDFAFTITDVDDTAPTNIQLSNLTLIKDQATGTLIGTLSATDVDTDNDTLSFSVESNINFEIDGKQLKTKRIIPSTTGSISIFVTASDGRYSSSKEFIINVIDNPNPAIINSGNVERDEGTDLTALTFDVSNEPSTQILTYSINGADKDLFTLNNGVITFKVAPNYDNPTDNGSNNVYNLTLEVNDGFSTTTKGVMITILNVNEQTIGINDQTLAVNEGSSVDAIVGSVATTGTPISFSITSGNNAGLFKINNTTGQIQVATTGLDYETTKSYTLVVKITGADADYKSASVSITINDIDDIAPTNITLDNNKIVVGAAANTTIGNLFATDVDSNNNTLSFSVDDSTNFVINGNKLQIKQVTTTAKVHTIKITAGDGTNTSAEQVFTINLISNPNPANITNQSSITRNEGDSKTALTITANDTGNSTLSYAISGTDAGLFTLTGQVVTFKVAPDYDNPTDNGSNNVYNLTLEVNDGVSTTAKDIMITILNIKEQALTIEDQILTVDENSAVNAVVGNIVTTGTPSSFSITSGNNAGLFKINSTTGQIQVATAGLDYETTKTYTLIVKITGADADDKTANITINLNNLADTSVEQTPTLNITGGGKFSIGKVVILTANANDPDAKTGDTLTYAWTQTAGDTITLSATNTKVVTFTTTKAMEGKSFTLKAMVTDKDNHNVSASTTITVNNAQAVAQAVRKESKAAAKVLLTRVGKTVMGRLSYLRQKQNKQSGFNANGFVNGIQFNFIDTKLSTAVNAVLQANGASATIPTPEHKINNWNTWTSAKIVIGNSKGNNSDKTKFTLKSINAGLDRRISKDKTIGFALGLGKEERTATGADFSGTVNTNQWTLSTYGALELNPKNSIEAVFGIAKSKHKVSSTATDDQDSNGYFSSIAYRGDITKDNLDLSPFVRYDISRIKMEATDILSNSESTTNEAVALGVDASNTISYKEGTLSRFINLEYRSDIRRDGTDYISKNAEQEMTMKLGVAYQNKDTTLSINYERVQDVNNKAHSDGIEGALRWKF